MLTDRNAYLKAFHNQGSIFSYFYIDYLYTMLIRTDYLQIIEEVRNLEKSALDDYINKKLIPLKNDNETFIPTLYKDIYYVLNGVDKPREGDLIIENGDIAIEDGDFKVSGYQTRLHNLIIWLHSEVV